MDFYIKQSPRFKPAFRCCSVRLAVYVAVGIACSVACRAAEPLERVPGSPDPLLRVAPIEPERIRPLPTPDLSATPLPGTQTIILRDYGASRDRDAKPAEPVVLHVPNRYLRRNSSQPAEMWELALLLVYPSLEPDPGGESRCGQPWCGDELFINLTNNRRTSIRAQIEGLEATISQHSDGSTAYEAITPPPGYDAAYIRSFPRDPSGPRRKEILIIRDNEHHSGTLGECSMDTPGKLCDFYSSYPHSNIKIHYSTRIVNLPKRAEIEASILTLIEISFKKR